MVRDGERERERERGGGLRALELLPQHFSLVMANWEGGGGSRAPLHTKLRPREKINRRDTSV